MLGYKKALSAAGLIFGMSVYSGVTWAEPAGEEINLELLPAREIGASAMPATEGAVENMPAASVPVVLPSVSGQGWRAGDGQTLRQVVESWGKRANWKVQWLAGDLDYGIGAGFGFKGTFKHAITSLAYTYAGVERPLRFEFWDANRTLVVAEKKS